MREPDWAPLTGFRVAVTSARRAEELSALLPRRGATVTSAAAIDDGPAARRRRTARPHQGPDRRRRPTWSIATTGIGLRGWIAAADGWGLANDLTAALGKARIVSRGPKATGALRAAGLPEEWSPESESSREVRRTTCVEGGIEGLRIAVQLHGATDDWDPFPEFLDELRAAGAEVVPIRVYRWHPAPRDGAFDQLVAGIAERKFDAVSFTSAPAVAAMLMRAVELGIEDQVLAALRTDVHAMCVGPVTARPLVRLGVPTSAPERMRLGALARHITDELPLLQSRTVHGGRPRAGDPRHLRAGRRRGQGAVAGGHGDHPRAGPPARAPWCRAATCSTPCPAAAPTPTPSRPPCCGCERRWATSTSCRPSSNAGTGWPSTRPVGVA